MRLVMQRNAIVVPENVSIHDGDPDRETLRRLVTEADIILVEHTVIPTGLISAAPRLKGVVFMGMGVGTYLDVRHANSRGIEVMIVPDYGNRAVAEHAVALLLSAARNVAAMDRGIRSSQWEPKGGTQLVGRRVAVIGLGGIGLEFARISEALGMKVSGWNRSPRSQSFWTTNLDAALENADFVSLHLGLNGETRHIIGERELGLPRKGYILVNTARAGLVNQRALVAALDDGTVGHAALDVFESEPPSQHDPLLKMENVTMTAHAAYMTEDAYVSLWELTARRLADLTKLLASRHRAI